MAGRRQPGGMSLGRSGKRTQRPDHDEDPKPIHGLQTDGWVGLQREGQDEWPAAARRLA